MMAHSLKKLTCILIVAALTLVNTAAAYAVQSCPHMRNSSVQSSAIPDSGQSNLPCHDDHVMETQNTQDTDGFCDGDDCLSCLKCFTSLSILPQQMILPSHHKTHLNAFSAMDMASVHSESAYHPPIVFS